MLEKITFEKHLGINSKENIWLGLKVATVSGLMAFFGGLVMYLGFQTIGKFFAILGICGGFIGILLHFVLGILKLLNQKNNRL